MGEGTGIGYRQGQATCTSGSSYLRSAGPSRDRLWSGGPADAQDVVWLGRLAHERGGAGIGLEHEKSCGRWQVEYVQYMQGSEVRPK